MLTEIDSEGGRTLVLLPALTIGAAVAATATTPKIDMHGMQHLAIQAKFLYGAGGTTAKAYIQTSLDRGTTWIDIASFAFSTAAATKISALSSAIALAAAATPTDGTLADNTILNGFFGDRLRVKYVTTGTYTGATSLEITAVAKS